MYGCPTVLCQNLFFEKEDAKVRPDSENKKRHFICLTFDIFCFPICGWSFVIAEYPEESSMIQWHFFVFVFPHSITIPEHSATSDAIFVNVLPYIGYLLGNLFYFFIFTNPNVNSKMTSYQDWESTYSHKSLSCIQTNMSVAVIGSLCPQFSLEQFTIFSPDFTMLVQST